MSEAASATYDIVIVGGGPSGALAAIQLAGSGARVLLLDRARFPRLKPCGGGIRYSVYERFANLRPVLDSVPTNLVTRLVMESPAGERVEISLDRPLYAMIRRLEFDQALLNHVKSLGIEVGEQQQVVSVQIENDGVRLRTASGDELRAELVLGCDGVNSTVATSSGLRARWPKSQMAMDGTEETPANQLAMRQDTMYVYYGLGGQLGYGYVFPKAAHVNFGLGYLLEGREVGDPYAKHLQFLARMQREGVLRGRSERSNFHTYVLPIGGPCAATASERVILAGDAAGFVNGFTGEGIYYAMVSGEWAGRAAAAALRQRNFSAAFLRRQLQGCDAEIGAELRASVRVQQQLFANPARVDSMIRAAAHSPKLCRLMTECALGMISHRQMRQRALREALPAYLGYKWSRFWLGLHKHNKG